MPRPLTDPIRNRRGCFVILAVLALFAALYLFVGFSASPGNEASETIPTMPAD
jgi:hypothetical protein